MVSSVVADAIADVLASGKTDVAGAVIVVQDVDAALSSEVTELESRPDLADSPEQSELSGVARPWCPLDLLPVPEHAVAPDESLESAHRRHGAGEYCWPQHGGGQQESRCALGADLAT